MYTSFGNFIIIIIIIFSTFCLLHFSLSLCQELTDLCCVDCHVVVTHKKHMFSMSVDGPLAAYVNPGGYVHDTLTVMEVKGLKKQGRASEEHSWFPGLVRVASGARVQHALVETIE